MLRVARCFFFRPPVPKSVTAVEFQIEQIDHAEILVPDREQAAQWYGRMFGMQIVDEYRFWSELPGGPLMITTPSGNTKIALFQGESHGSRRGTGFHLLAFRTNADNFLQFLDSLDTLSLTDRHGERVTKRMVHDHKLAFSVYFCDPWGNELEITSYEHDAIRSQII